MGRCGRHNSPQASSVIDLVLCRSDGPHVSVDTVHPYLFRSSSLSSPGCYHLQSLSSCVVLVSSPTCVAKPYILYLNSITCGSLADCILTFCNGIPFRHMYSAFALDTFIPLVSKASLHCSSSNSITSFSLAYSTTSRLQKLMEVIYRILNGLYPSYLNDIITVEELQHLRCRSRLFIPPFSTVRYGKKCLSYLSPVLWNSLGNDIKQCDVLTAFKKRIKLWKGPTCNCGFCAQCRISNR